MLLNKGKMKSKKRTEHFNFVHKQFFASGWEEEVKNYISNLSSSRGKIWYRDGSNDLKKLNQELIVLGFYVKYSYGEDSSVSFRLNSQTGDDEDGWIYKDGEKVKTVQ